MHTKGTEAFFTVLKRERGCDHSAKQILTCVPDTEKNVAGNKNNYKAKKFSFLLQSSLFWYWTHPCMRPSYSGTGSPFRDKDRVICFPLMGTWVKTFFAST